VPLIVAVPIVPHVIAVSPGEMFFTVQPVAGHVT
jgi:hypothetical protein